MYLAKLYKSRGGIGDFRASSLNPVLKVWDLLYYNRVEGVHFIILIQIL